MPEEKKKIYAKKEKDLESLHGKKREKETIHLKRSLLITEKTLRNIKNYPILTNGHAIYVKKSETLKQVEKKPFYFIDDYIPIYSPKDLEKLKDLQFGTVVVSLEKTIKDFILESISLENFVGTLIFLGNQKSLENGTMKEKDGITSLFSKIPPYTNLIIRNLKMANIIYENAEITGIFLGKREMISKGRYGSTEGYTMFENCSATSCEILGSTSNFPFVGIMNYSVEVKNCFYESIKSKDYTFYKKNMKDQFVAKVPNEFVKEFIGVQIQQEYVRSKQKKH